jgi:hypothetical protein
LKETTIKTISKHLAPLVAATTLSYDPNNTPTVAKSVTTDRKYGERAKI